MDTKSSPGFKKLPQMMNNATTNLGLIDNASLPPPLSPSPYFTHMTWWYCPGLQNCWSKTVDQKLFTHGVLFLESQYSLSAYRKTVTAPELLVDPFYRHDTADWLLQAPSRPG